MANTSSDSTDSYPARFDNEATREQYHSVIAAKNIWEEQGFLYDDGLDNYGLEMAYEDEAYDFIKNQLCIPGTEWNGDRNLGTINQWNLHPEAKLWNMFIKHNIMPTSHNSTMDKPRLVLINVIMTGLKFNVGQVIAKELSEACKTNRACLAFPCLILAFCRLVGVQSRPRDLYTPLRTGWACKDYMRKMDLMYAITLRVAMPPTAVAKHPEAHNYNSPVAADDQPSAAATPQATPAPALLLDWKNMRALQQHHSQPLQNRCTSHLLPIPQTLHQSTSLSLGSTPKNRARQLKFIEDTKVFQTSLVQFLTLQIPTTLAFFPNHQAAPPPANEFAAEPSVVADKIETVHYSSNTSSYAFD
ncbi:hypothetical protein V6N13_023153 [Hibiscus sabdariffa]